MSGHSSSTTQPSLSFTPASLISALQEPVPGSAQLSSPSPCAVTPVSPVSTFSTACAPIFIYYITVSIRCDPCFTGVSSSSAYSWVWAFFSSYTKDSTSFVSSFSAWPWIFRLRLLYFFISCIISSQYI